MRGRADADAKRDSSRRHFDRWAGRYERDRVSRRLAQIQRAALATLEPAEGDVVLDVGCGTGAAVRAAAAAARRAVGVDLSAQMIARGRELARELGNVEFFEADAESLPFADAGFTAVLCTTSLHHYPQPARAVREMARVLAPGGRVVIGDAVSDLPVMRVADAALRRLQPSHVGCLRSERLRELLADAGLREQRLRVLMGGVYALVLARREAA